MEKEKRVNYYDDDERVLIPPYWTVEYIDDYGRRHIATITDKEYLEFLKDRYDVVRIKVTEK